MHLNLTIWYDLWFTIILTILDLNCDGVLYNSILLRINSYHVNLPVFNFRKSWHPLTSLNPFLVMHPKWLLLTILYLLKVMYLYLLILEIWLGPLKVIAVFLDVEEQYHQTGKAVVYLTSRYLFLLELSNKLFPVYYPLQSYSVCPLFV